MSHYEECSQCQDGRRDKKVDFTKELTIYLAALTWCIEEGDKEEAKVIINKIQLLNHVRMEKEFRDNL